MTMSRKEHWEHVYETKSPTELSWFQTVPSKSMAMIRGTGVPTEVPPYFWTMSGISVIRAS